jgi:hypothetical protein
MVKGEAFVSRFSLAVHPPSGHAQHLAGPGVMGSSAGPKNENSYTIERHLAMGSIAHNFPPSKSLTLQRHFSEMSLETPLSRALYALSERTKWRLAELMQ